MIHSFLLKKKSTEVLEDLTFFFLKPTFQFSHVRQGVYLPTDAIRYRLQLLFQISLQIMTSIFTILALLDVTVIPADAIQAANLPQILFHSFKKKPIAISIIRFLKVRSQATIHSRSFQPVPIDWQIANSSIDSGSGC